MTKVQIGTYVIPQDEKRVRYAEFANYDKMMEVKAGEYPVYAYFSEISNYRVKDCYVDFGDWSESWYSFMMGQSENFKPAPCCYVHRYTFKSFSGDGSDVETAEIIYR